MRQSVEQRTEVHGFPGYQNRETAIAQFLRVLPQTLIN